jgi:hypothetical protein
MHEYKTVDIRNSSGLVNPVKPMLSMSKIDAQSIDVMTLTYLRYSSGEQNIRASIGIET